MDIVQFDSGESIALQFQLGYIRSFGPRPIRSTFRSAVSRIPYSLSVTSLLSTYDASKFETLKYFCTPSIWALDHAVLVHRLEDSPGRRPEREPVHPVLGRCREFISFQPTRDVHWKLFKMDRERYGVSAHMRANVGSRTYAVNARKIRKYSFYLTFSIYYIEILLFILPRFTEQSYHGQEEEISKRVVVDADEETLDDA